MKDIEKVFFFHEEDIVGLTVNILSKKLTMLYNYRD